MCFMKIRQFGKDNFSGLVSSIIFLLLPHLLVKHFSKAEWQVYWLSFPNTEFSASELKLSLIKSYLCDIENLLTRYFFSNR